MKIYMILFASIVIMTMACKNDKELEDAPDVSNIKVDVEFIRFDQEVMHISPTDIQKGYENLRGKYAAMTDLYFKNVIQLQPASDSVLNTDALKAFITDEKVKVLQDTIDVVMTDLSAEIIDIQKSLKYYKYYFPDKTIPRIYGCNSGFGYQRFIFDDDGERDGIGLGLEMFLGNEFPYKQVDPKNPIFSEYLTRTFNKAHMARTIVDMLVDDLIGEAPGVRLIDQMIHHGKKLYIIDKLMPFASDTILHEYTEKQMDWCKKNEKEMWSYFFDQKLFYETNAMKISKYLNPAPTSQGMPSDSPGRTANYIAWRIVQAYMEKFPDTTLQDLIKMRDAQKLLELSKYKPKRT